VEEEVVEVEVEAKLLLLLLMLLQNLPHLRFARFLPD
jgi:hypothetical protein